MCFRQKVSLLGGWSEMNMGEARAKPLIDNAC